MNLNLAAAARIIPLTALMLGACVSQSAYEKQGAELQQARAQSAAEQSQITKMQQEQKWVVAGDMLFPEGGYQLSANGKQALSQYVPKLQDLQNAKVVVYGYTDNLPVGPALQRAGIANNIDLSSRRADNVVAYLRLARRQFEHHLGQGVRRHACGCRERHAAGPGAKPPHRDRTGRPRRLNSSPLDRRMPGTTPNSRPRLDNSARRRSPVTTSSYDCVSERTLKWRRRLKRHTSVTLALTTTLLLLNTAIAQEIIKDKPTPSRAEWAPLGQAYGQDYSTSDVTKVVVIGSGTPAADPRHGGISVAVVVNGQPYIIDCGPGFGGDSQASTPAYGGKIAGLEPKKLTHLFLTHLHFLITYYPQPSTILSHQLMVRNRNIRLFLRV